MNQQDVANPTILSTLQCVYISVRFPIMIRLYCHATGHSLGGALATLAAYDIATAAEAAGRQLNLACYTFGCPRVGNHAFARDFEEVPPPPIHINCQFWISLGVLRPATGVSRGSLLCAAFACG